MNSPGTARTRRLLTLIAASALLWPGVVSAVEVAGPPPANAPLPRAAASVARSVVETTANVRKAIDGWRATGAPRPSSELTLYALYQQRLTRLLARDVPLARAVLRSLPSSLAPFVHDVVVAHRELVRITPPLRLQAVRVGPAAPAPKLLAYYHEAGRRFGVPWYVLGAVNFVESAFGKLRSASGAGAQGPMQFMPDTWRAYGMGGNVHDPRAAILGAANYLRAAGAQRDLGHALHVYNPSRLYVDAVLRYARRIRADVHAFYTFYCWQVFVRTTAGVRRLTGPGLR